MVKPSGGYDNEVRTRSEKLNLSLIHVEVLYFQFS